MGENFCPACGEPLAVESINLAEGVALCPACGQLSRLSDVASRRRPLAEVLSKPPAGCAVSEWGQDVLVHATLRSLGGFVGMLFVALFWNGIVSVFVLIALAGLHHHLIGPLPAWFPAPQLNPPMGLGMTLFLCIFLIPFVTIGSLLVGAMLLNLVGKVEVRIGISDADVRTGLGFLAWRRRFDPTCVRRVSIGSTSWETNGRPSEVVVIDADRTIKFGSLLAEDRREWLQAILTELLTNQKLSQRREILSAARFPGSRS
jgi:hypothetical protein